MDAFVTALREREPLERIASFFPQRSAWEFVRTPDRAAPGARTGLQRFGPEHTLAAIREGGPVCGSFGGVTGDVGPWEGALVAQAMWIEGRWRYAGRNRFVPPGRGPRSPIYVQWSREGSTWVVTRIGEEYPYSPAVLGEIAYRGVTRDTTAGAGLPLERRLARSARWYQEHEPISFRGHRYVKYGLPRRISDAEVERFGSYEMVPVYVERGSKGLPDVLYVLTAPGEYQPYQSYGHSICREN